MDEVEVKILEIKRQVVEQKLIELGAKKIFDGKLYAVMFDFPENQFAKEGKLLRLRKEGEKKVLTFKTIKSKEKVKIAEELELIVSDFDGMRKILTQLGLREVVIIEKNRISYSMDKNHFDIDQLEGELSGIPEYLEIEGPNKEAIFKAAKTLGFSQEDCKAWDANDLLSHYGKFLPGLII